MELNRLHNRCCMEGMAEIPDGFFELALVDPPFGIHGATTEPYAQAEASPRGWKAKKNPFCGAGVLKHRALNRAGKTAQAWNIAPGPGYFRELFRVSRNQIIWGGNYFALPATRGFIVWDKAQPFENFSAAEYAWTSFDTPAKIFRLAATLAVPAKGRIHPTQKPIALYEFCLRHFAKPGDKILDTHAGSGSCLIAAHRFGHDWLGFEVDPDYHRLASERLENERRQGRLFPPGPPAKSEGESLFKAAGL